MGRTGRDLSVLTAVVFITEDSAIVPCLAGISLNSTFVISASNEPSAVLARAFGAMQYG